MPSLARYQAFAQDTAGNVLVSPTIEVRDENNGALAPLFSDRAGATGLGNPFAGDTDGYFGFHVAGGAYKITITQGAITRTFRWVGIGTASERDMFTPIATTDNAIARYDGTIGLVQNSGVLVDDTNAITPAANDNGALGSSSLRWSDLSLAVGAVVDFGGDVTVTHSTDLLAFAGAANGYSFDAPLRPVANDGTSLGTSALSFSDLFLAATGVINFAAGDVTITHSTDALTFAGGSYLFNGSINPSSSGASSLGDGTHMFSNLFLNSAGKIDFNNGDVTITHSTDTLTFAGGVYLFNGEIAPSASGTSQLGDATHMFSSLFINNGGKIDFNAGNVTLTHSAAALTIAGGALILAAGTTAIAPLKFQSGTLNTTPAAGAREYDGKAFYATPVASARAVDVIEHFISLSANQTGTNGTGTQTWFPGGGAVSLNVAASTSYFFEGLLLISNGGTSHQLVLNFASSTCSFTAIDYVVEHSPAVANTTNTTTESTYINGSSGVAVGAASTAAGHVVRVRGIARISGAGLLKPEFNFTVAPGSCTVLRDTNFRIRPIGADTVLSVV